MTGSPLPSIPAPRRAPCYTTSSRPVGRDAAGRTALAVDDRLLEQLLAFDAGAEDLEDDGDAELDAPPVLSSDRVPARRFYRAGSSSHLAISLIAAL